MFFSFNELKNSLTSTQLPTIFIGILLNSLKIMDLKKTKLSQELLKLPWSNQFEKLKRGIEKTIDLFPQTDPIETGLSFPSNGLAGVYFSLGGDAYTLGLSGSIYFGEDDWAANADFYPSHDFMPDFDIRELLDEHVSEHFSESDSEDLAYAFAVFVVYQTMLQIPPKDALVNTGISVGFSTGDETLLGVFEKGKFKPRLLLVETGAYNKPSSAPVVENTFEPRGPLWDYLHHNYGRFMEEQGVRSLFNKLGEAEAHSIEERFSKEIVINRCKKCSFIKKTPLANQCLNCGDFSVPEYLK